MIAALLFSRRPEAKGSVWDCEPLRPAFEEMASILLHKSFRLLHMEVLVKAFGVGGMLRTEDEDEAEAEADADATRILQSLLSDAMWSRAHDTFLLLCL
jgi:hypothetical protein